MRSDVGITQSTDIDGRIVTSSKRWVGLILIVVGAAMLVTIGLIAICRPIADAVAALQAGQILVVSGAALLGIGVLDGLGEGIGRSMRGGPRD